MSEEQASSLRKQIDDKVIDAREISSRLAVRACNSTTPQFASGCPCLTNPRTYTFTSPQDS